MAETETESEVLKQCIDKYIDFDTVRWKEWVDVSANMSVAFDTSIQILVQSLGKVDSKIIFEEDIIAKTGSSSSLFGDLTWISTLIHLWTIGSYELIRTINGLINPECMRSKGIFENKKLHNLKNEFEYIRVPLAKIESPKNLRGNPEMITLKPSFSEDHFCWSVNDGSKIIKRIDLSDTMIDVFKELGYANENAQ